MKNTVQKEYRLNYSEISTILAALRYWQDEYSDYPEIADYMPHFDDVLPLSKAEIDTLCEKINSGGVFSV